MKSHFRKKENPNRFFVIFLVLVLIVFLLNLFPGTVRPFFYSFSSPIQKIFWSWGDNCSDFFSGLFRGVKLEKEKENLKLENQRLISEITRLKSLEKENGVLRKALEAGLKEEFVTVFTRIISKEFSKDILLINKGEGEGIEKGMPVITPEKVLAGRVIETFEGFSKIEIVSNKEFSFDVRVLDKEIVALAKGQGSAEIMLDLIPKESEIVVGDTVITAGLEESIPADLLVGRVKEVYKEDVKSMQRATVEPEFNLDRNFYLFVIKSK